jgi:hypothetical protein
MRMARAMSSRELDALDRHALVMAVWLPLILVAATAFHYGFHANAWPFVAAGFATLIVAFAGHVIVNVIRGTEFTERELALGLVVYCAAALAVGFAMLFSPVFRSDFALTASLGLVGTAAAIILTMILWLGPRGAFDAFDVIRRFKP